MANNDFNKHERRLGALNRLENLLPLCQADHEEKPTEEGQANINRMKCEIGTLKERLFSGGKDDR